MDTQPSKEKRIPDELARYLNELRMRVHRYRRYGLLPEGRGTLRLRARRGSGLTCLVCGEPVLGSEPEIIIECEPDPELVGEDQLARFCAEKGARTSVRPKPPRAPSVHASHEAPRCA